MEENFSLPQERSIMPLFILYALAALSILVFVVNPKTRRIQGFGTLLYGSIVAIVVGVIKLIVTHIIDWRLMLIILSISILIGDFFIGVDWYARNKTISEYKSRKIKRTK
jgi:hypothetical protein